MTLTATVLVLSSFGAACSGSPARGHRDGSATGPGGMEATIVTASTHDGLLDVTWESSQPVQNIWDPACGTGPRLFVADAYGWVALRDDRPLAGTMQPYFVDGVYVPNQSLGCDGGNSCYASSGTSVSSLEYVQMGTQPPPAPYYPAGATGPTEAPVPDLITRATAGPYQLEVKYMLGSCPSANVGSVRLDVPPL
jgi:hypothetical protein